MPSVYVKDAATEFELYCLRTRQALNDGHDRSLAYNLRAWLLTREGADAVAKNLEIATSAFLGALPALLAHFNLVEDRDGDDPWGSLSSVGFAGAMYQASR